MLKLVLVTLLPFLLLFGASSEDSVDSTRANGQTGLLKKMVVSKGTVVIDLDLSQIARASKKSRGGSTVLSFSTNEETLFKILVFDDELRGALPGTMELEQDKSASIRVEGLPLDALSVEYLPWSSDYEMAVKDSRTGFTFFSIEGIENFFDAKENSLGIHGGRLLLSKEFAAQLGRPGDAGAIVGGISIDATVSPIEVTQIVEGDVLSDVLPPVGAPDAGTVPGPDVIVGDVSGLQQVGAQSGTQVGLTIATDSCNLGTVPLNWFALPQVDHPVIPQNLYRMSGGGSNNERFEQVGQSSLKHAFTALQNNLCGLGCVANPNGTALGSGCSDPYSVSNNSAQSSLGSRAWVNPFTGSYPSTSNSHTGHNHAGPSHRILTEVSDINPSINAGATYFAEGQYVTPHEYAWCQSHPGQCNMYNNVSYRQYNVSGTTVPYSFSPVGNTVRQKSAIEAWTGASFVRLEPDPGIDGTGMLAYKVTNPSPGIWHYEYAVYNQNLDRGIRSLQLSMGSSVILNNIGFHAPPQHPGWAGDGTVGNTGYSSTPWTSVRNAGDFVWSTETFAQNQNANAIRWGTLYNFRFDANYAPMLRPVTIGFFKTGAPITMLIQVPTALVTVSGRVLDANGRGVAGAKVTLVDDWGYSSGNITTDKRGGYTINNVPSGGSFTLNASQRRHTFTPAIVQINDATAAVNITAE